MQVAIIRYVDALSLFKISSVGNPTEYERVGTIIEYRCV